MEGFNLNGCDGAASFSQARKLSDFECSGRVALIFPERVQPRLRSRTEARKSATRRSQLASEQARDNRGSARETEKDYPC